ncbi:MAG: GDSL-type esterase/lipase family protein [Acidobacteriota bacterium]
MSLSTPRAALVRCRLVGLLLLCVVSSLLLPASSGAQSPIFHAFGDSLTYGFGDDGVDCELGPRGGWPVPLRQRLNSGGLSTAVVNRGLCGETTAEGLSRLDELLETTAGQAVILQEGTNDLSSTQISVESIRFNLLNMVQAVRDADRVPLLSSPPPRMSDDSASNRTGFLASLLTQDAQEFDVAYTNQYDLLLGVNGLFDLYIDPLHPNRAGYGLMADNFVPAALDVVERVRNGSDGGGGMEGCDIEPTPCVVDDQTLCLNDGRFGVTVSWRDFEGNTGVGTAVSLSADTGYFWFFDDANIELVLKVLDGRPVNDAFWVFYGALSNVEYTVQVVDAQTGTCREYENPLGDFASVGDTGAFPQEDVVGGASVARPATHARSDPKELPRGDAATTATKATCIEDTLHVCLNEGRFRVSARWRDFEGNTGDAMAVPRTADTGTFWFFDEANIELVIKVLDGVGVNQHYWVFYGALSNVEYEIRVEDTDTNAVRTYFNPLGDFASQADVEAFPEP